MSHVHRKLVICVVSAELQVHFRRVVLVSELEVLFTGRSYSPLEVHLRVSFATKLHYTWFQVRRLLALAKMVYQ